MNTVLKKMLYSSTWHTELGRRNYSCQQRRLSRWTG